MQTYPNYSMINPMYQQPFQQQFNPYMQRMENLQQFQQAIQPAQQGIVTRVVNDFSTLTANDVPMSGGAFFVKADGSEIEQREWSANGQIVAKRYKAILDTPNANPNILSTEDKQGEFDALKEFLGAFEERLNSLDNKMDEILKQKPFSKLKKEVLTDE